MTARLDFDDALLIDNSASAILHPIISPQVVLVTDRKPILLIQMLRTNPKIVFNQTNIRDYHGYGDIIIFDQWMPTILPAGNVIFLASQNDFSMAELVESKSSAHVINQDNTHPILRDIPQLNMEVQRVLIG